MIIEILQHTFMVRALIAGLAVGVVAPLIGMFLVVRRYSLLADTLAHVSLLGVAIGLLAGWHPVGTAVAVAIVLALVIEYLRRSRRLSGESVLALILSGSLAVAVVLISIADGFNVDLLSFLFGSITTVTMVDLYVIIGFTIVAVAIIIALYRRLFVVVFDEELAQAEGLNVTLLNTVLVALAAVAVALSMRIVGVLLIGALMVIPVVAAMQFRRGFKTTIWLAIVFSLLATLTGLVLSFYLDLASGGTIVVVALFIFVLSLVLNRKK